MSLPGPQAADVAFLLRFSELLYFLFLLNSHPGPFFKGEKVSLAFCLPYFLSKDLPLIHSSGLWALPEPLWPRQGLVIKSSCRLSPGSLLTSPSQSFSAISEFQSW